MVKISENAFLADPQRNPRSDPDGWLDYDLIDDDALAVAAPDRYRVVIIPATTMIMEVTANWLSEVISAGGSVIMIDTTVQIPGAITVAAARLADALSAAVTPDLAISPPTPDIGFVHRRHGDTELCLVINTGPTTRRFGIAPPAM